MYYFGKSEENMDLSRIHLPVITKQNNCRLMLAYEAARNCGQPKKVDFTSAQVLFWSTYKKNLKYILYFL